MIIPDPWFENVLEDESRFVAQDCRFIEIWQQKDGEVSTQTGPLRAEEIEDWVKENVSLGGYFAAFLQPSPTLTCM